MTHLRTGIALAITVGVFYALCALIWTTAPGPSLGFLNSLFHGMDFGSMARPGPFAFQGFFTSLIVLCIWALLAGTFYAWLGTRMSRLSKQD